MNVVALAFRNLGRQRRRTLLLGGALAVGVLVMGLLNTVAAALTANVQANLVESLGGDVFVSARETSATGRVIPVVRDPSVIEAAFEAAGIGVAQVDARSSARVALLFQGAAETVTLEGLSPRAWDQLDQRLAVLSGDWGPAPRSLALPRIVAEKLGVVAGDEVLVRGQTITGQENVDAFVVTAVVDDPAAFGVPVVYGRLAAVNELLNLPPGTCQTLTLTLKTGTLRPSTAQQWYDSLKAFLPVEAPSLGGDLLGGFAASLRGAGGGRSAGPGPVFTVRTLEQTMAPLLGLVDTLRVVNTGLLALMMVVILVGISNTFRMVLLERTREIGTLRALGMHRHQVLALFLAEALVLAGASGLVGTLVGAGLGAWVGLLSWPDLAGSVGGIFFRSGRLGLVFPWREALAVWTAVTTIGLAAAWGPARSAARVAPAEALRTQN